MTKCASQVPAQSEPEGEAVLEIHFEGYLAASPSIRAGKDSEAP
jgi:hypothetical protein